MMLMQCASATGDEGIFLLSRSATPAQRINACILIFDVAVVTTFVLSALSSYPITGYGDGVLWGGACMGVFDYYGVCVSTFIACVVYLGCLKMRRTVRSAAMRVGYGMYGCRRLSESGTEMHKTVQRIRATLNAW